MRVGASGLWVHRVVFAEPALSGFGAEVGVRGGSRARSLLPSGLGAKVVGCPR